MHIIFLIIQLIARFNILNNVPKGNCYVTIKYFPTSVTTGCPIKFIKKTI